MALLEVENLRTYFYTRGGIVRAVDNVSFSLEQGETMGIVGESGSGLAELFSATVAPRSGQENIHDLPGSDDIAESLHADLGSAR
jgi:ABC-type dipeptide/oligopeptide/nickel transport system ATPase component